MMFSVVGLKQVSLSVLEPHMETLPSAALLLLLSVKVKLYSRSPTVNL